MPGKKQETRKPAPVSLSMFVTTHQKAPQIPNDVKIKVFKFEQYAENFNPTGNSEDQMPRIQYLQQAVSPTLTDKTMEGKNRGSDCDTPLILLKSDSDIEAKSNRRVTA